MLTHFSLFSGIGGIDLAAEWAGFTTVGQCEWADYPTKVLEKHWPDVPRWRDIRELTYDKFVERTGIRTVNLISGGFPCQPFSVAGKQKGKDDNRYLWPEMLRVIRELTPTWVVGENVPGILRIAGKTVCEDLEREGYAVTVFNFEAAAVGAPHRRDRVFFVGYSEHNGQFTEQELRGYETSSNNWRKEKQEKTGEFERTGRPIDELSIYRSKFRSEQHTEREVGRGNTKENEIMAHADNARSRTSEHGVNGNGKEKIEGREEQPLNRIGRCSEVVANADSEGLQGWENTREECRDRKKSINQQFSRCDTLLGNYWSVEPDVGRVANGVPNRVDRLKCLGNAVVPQQVYPILKAIAEIEKI